MVIDRSTIPLEMLGEPDDTECPHGIPTGMGIECWECRYEELNKDHIALENDYAALEQRCRELEEDRNGWKNDQLQMQDISDGLFESNNALGALLKEAKAKNAELEAENAALKKMVEPMAIIEALQERHNDWQINNWHGGYTVMIWPEDKSLPRAEASHTNMYRAIAEAMIPNKQSEVWE